MSEEDASTFAGPVQRHNPPTMLDATEIGNSQISVADVGRLAFVAGQTATPPDALDQLGASACDIVAFRLYVVGATEERFKQAWSSLRELFQGEMPSGTALGVQALWTPELQLEVEMVVRVPSSAN